MSWDLYIVPREHADDPNDWLESVADSRGDAAAAAEHADAIRARRPELEPFGPDESGMIELSAPEESGLPVQILLDGRHGGLGVAYWDLGEREEELADLVDDIVTALCEATGWVAFDPQDDRVLEPDQVRAAFLGGHEHGVGLVGGTTAEDEPPEPPPTRRRRFFGLFG